MAWAASDAVAFSPLPLMHPEHHLQGLEPHFVAEKYLYSDDPSSANRIVDIGDTLPIKLAALAEHKTQMDFLVQDVLMQARLGGLDLRPMLGEALDDPMAAVRWAMEAQASQVGARGGFRYGEAFRYTRFHPFVENLLGSQAGV